MANKCDFKMRVTGEKENITKFLKNLDSSQECKRGERHRYRGRIEFAACKIARTEDIEEVEVFGCCDWSVYYSMMSSQSALVHDTGELIPIHNSLQGDSAELGLVIEIFSNEPLECIEEHYLIAFGENMASEKRVSIHDSCLGDPLSGKMFCNAYLIFFNKDEEALIEAISEYHQMSTETKVTKDELLNILNIN